MSSRSGGAALALAATLALAAGGCGLTKRANVRNFTLATVPTEAPIAAFGGLPLGIGTVELPPGLDRREIVVREPDHRLDVRGTELWAAPLETLVLHTLAFDLAERLPAGAMILPGQLQPAGGLRSLDLVFGELAAGPEAALVLDVHWTLRTGNAGPADLAGHERIREPLDSLDSASIAAGTSRALAALADRLVAAAAAGRAPVG